eukprot:CAMPEP_0170154050 /NCGR_PEP_ID=MMETSP0033_2-20121228/56922_1 /TAXON_ID=195969 /ORGANISM="Dolichomastix tenuilepis, Strain CCMP3274" /LENGTH=61 /DNA_ID=CAMNT_0010391281 /DNA_START=165 /DNA_END=346 /DNA_ORIENTATION=-
MHTSPQRKEASSEMRRFGAGERGSSAGAGAGLATAELRTRRFFGGSLGDAGVGAAAAAAAA